MALSKESAARAAQRKAQLARRKVRTAEAELAAANQTLKEALPRRDVEAIAGAAERTATAEDEVREAAQELDAVNELLEGSACPSSPGGASGEGARSLLPWLRKDEHPS